MNKSRYGIFLIALFLFLGVGIFMSTKIYKEGNTYKQEMIHYVELLNFKERLLNAKEWVYGEWEFKQRRDLSEMHYEEAEKAMDKTKLYSVIYASGAILFFIIIALAFYKHPLYFRFLGLTLVAISFLSLIVGISVPLLEIGAFNLDLEVPVRGTIPYLDVPFDFSKTFEGRLYYYYEIKSVVGLIAILFKSKNFVVAISILLFSIILPAAKLSLSLVMLLNRRVRENKRLGKIVSRIGKWSMADVFVAGCFLAFLSFYNMNPGIETDCNTLPGLYFFFAYCILSIFSSLLIEVAIESEGQKNEELI